jgi:hypothetical protein
MITITTFILIYILISIITYVVFDINNFNTYNFNTYNKNKSGNEYLALLLLSILWPITYTIKFGIFLYKLFKDKFKPNQYLDPWEDYIVEMNHGEITYRKKLKKQFKFGRKYCK